MEQREGRYFTFRAGDALGRVLHAAQRDFPVPGTSTVCVRDMKQKATCHPLSADGAKGFAMADLWCLENKEWRGEVSSR